MRPESRVDRRLDLDLMALMALRDLAAAPRAVSLYKVFDKTFADTRTEFAHGKVDPVEAGKKGGNS